MRKDLLKIQEIFFESVLPDSYGRPRKVYLMNRDGFALLAMGFTGSKALEWKLKYIQAFNEMEQRLKQPFVLPQTYLEALQ
jgi:anti-repressor protein